MTSLTFSKNVFIKYFFLSTIFQFRLIAKNILKEKNRNNMNMLLYKLNFQRRYIHRYSKKRAAYPCRRKNKTEAF